jgi:hypothetical protein
MNRMQNEVQSQAQLDRSSLQQLVSNLETNLRQEISNGVVELATKQRESNSDLAMIMMQTLQATTRIIQMMSQAQSEIPGQVLRQQPVYLEDARGVLVPFHLEFVTCVDVSCAIALLVKGPANERAQVLICALKKRYGESGARKVEERKFAITDAETLRDIDLTRAWERCFRPGQRVNMSLFFENIFTKTTTCPSCRAECAGPQDEEIECPNCGILFRRIEIPQPQSADLMDSHNEQGRNDRSNISKSAEARPGPPASSDGIDSPPQDEDDEALNHEISEYKRIRLVNDGRIRWDPLTCAQELRISTTGLGVAFPGPQTRVNTRAFAFVRTTRSGKGMSASPSPSAVYFEITVRTGDVCVGFCAEKTPSVAVPGIDGLYVYCGNSGELFTGSAAPLITGPSVRPGDVVGCGLHDRIAYFALNRKHIGGIEIDRKHHPSSLYPVIGLKQGASVVANFCPSILRPSYIRVQFWVCCGCSWTTNTTSAQCINCQHAFSTSHCSKETHDVPFDDSL